MPAVVVRLLEASSVARECLELLRGVLRSSLEGWSEVLKLSGRNDTFGCCRNSWRWGEVYVALWADWKVVVDFWSFGECFWGVELV